MANGKVIEELTEMLNSPVPPKARDVQRLTLVLLGELHGKVDELDKAVKEDVKTIKKNPMVMLGNFIDKHPKSFAAIITSILLLSNVWFIDEVRYLVLTWLKIPEEIIKLLVH